MITSILDVFDAAREREKEEDDVENLASKVFCWPSRGIQSPALQTRGWGQWLWPS